MELGVKKLGFPRARTSDPQESFEAGMNWKKPDFLQGRWMNESRYFLENPHYSSVLFPTSIAGLLCPKVFFRVRHRKFHLRRYSGKFTRKNSWNRLSERSSLVKKKKGVGLSVSLIIEKKFKSLQFQCLVPRFQGSKKVCEEV